MLYVLIIHQTLSVGRVHDTSVSDESIKMGNKLLVYISCTMAGMAYPRGDIPHNLRSKVKDQVSDLTTVSG